MALVLNDRVKETTTTTGTGTVNLAGAETGFETFVAGIGNTNTTYYAIVHQSANEFEVGLGTVSDATPDTLSRTTIISSSNSDSAVNFSAGTKDVFCTLPASKVIFEDASNNVAISSGDVAIGSRGTNPMGLSITGTVLAVTEASNVASVQIDGVTGTRIDMGTNSSRNAVFCTDANQLEISRTTDHPIIFKVNSSEVGRFVSTELKLASGKKLVGGATSGSVDFTIQSEHRTEIRGASKGTVLLSDAGTVYGLLERPTSTNDFDIQNPISDGDITFVGNDGGSTITALTLDMSDAGRALFNGSVDIGGTNITRTGDLTIDVSGDITLDAGGENIKLHDDGTEVGQIDLGSSNVTIRSSVQDKNTIFRGNDGGTEIEAMRIDYAEGGRVGIGTNSPLSELHVSDAGDCGIMLQSTNCTDDKEIFQIIAGANPSSECDLVIRTRVNAGTGGTEHMRITQTGDVGIGTSSPAVKLGVSGAIIASDNITAYGTPSDIRLKENIEVIDNALDKVKQLKGITYDLKSDGNRLTGLIAQDLEKVLPEAVYETSAVDDADDKHLAIRYGNTVGLLVEAIKELEARVKELEGK